MHALSRFALRKKAEYVGHGQEAYLNNVIILFFLLGHVILIFILKFLFLTGIKMNHQYLMKIISRILQRPICEIMMHHLSMLFTVGVISPIARDLSLRLLLVTQRMIFISICKQWLGIYKTQVFDAICEPLQLLEIFTDIFSY